MVFFKAYKAVRIALKGGNRIRAAGVSKSSNVTYIIQLPQTCHGSRIIKDFAAQDFVSDIGRVSTSKF